MSGGLRLITARLYPACSTSCICCQLAYCPGKSSRSLARWDWNVPPCRLPAPWVAPACPDEQILPSSSACCRDWLSVGSRSRSRILGPEARVSSEVVDVSWHRKLLPFACLATVFFIALARSAKRTCSRVNDMVMVCGGLYRDREGSGQQRLRGRLDLGKVAGCGRDPGSREVDTEGSSSPRDWEVIGEEELWE